MNRADGRANESHSHQTGNITSESLATACHFSTTMLYIARFKEAGVGIAYVAENLPCLAEADNPARHTCPPTAPA